MRALPARTRRCASGFTLVELLVALMVMALLSLMSWRGIDAMARAQTLTQARTDDVIALRNGLEQWGADLDAMVTEMAPPRAGTPGASPLDWDGQVFRITRYSRTPGNEGLRVVAWTLGDDKGRMAWLRWQSPVLRSRPALQEAWQQAALWAQNPGVGPRHVGILPMADWQIFYYRNDAWTNPGSSADGAALIPDGVRLVLNLPPGMPLVGDISRDWIRPSSVGAKS